MIHGEFKLWLYAAEETAYERLELPQRRLSCWVISYLEQGSVTLNLPNEKRVVRAGSVTVHPPNQPFTERSSTPGVHTELHGLLILTESVRAFQRLSHRLAGLGRVYVPSQMGTA